jgi:hypothetical protein
MADNTKTLNAAYAERLDGPIRTATSFTHKWTIPYTEVYNAALTAQGDTLTITLGTTPTRFLVKNAAAVVTTAFTTAAGTLTFTFGTSTTVNNYLTASDAKTAAAVVLNQGGDPVTLAGSFGASAVTLVCRFATQASTGALSDVTGGSLVIMASILDLDDII